MQFVGYLVVELDQENGLARLGIELEQVARSLEIELPARLVEEHPVDVLDRRRVEVEQVDRGLHRFRDRGEEEQTETFLARERHDL